MKTPRIVNAMEYIDDDLISGAVTYTRQNRKWWTNWKTIAACVAVVALLFGILPFFNNNPTGSPFVLTAYAAGTDNKVTTSEMNEGVHVPVSTFEANNGLWGFVFSYSTDDFKQPVSISIINADERVNVDGAIEMITGIEMDDSQKYIFYIPPQDEEGPYSLTFTIQDNDSNTIAMITLLIERTEGGYTSMISELKSYPRKETP